MSGDLLWSALALTLVFEGLMPFVSPSGWRHVFQQVANLRDGQIRFFGLGSILAGLLLFWLMH